MKLRANKNGSGKIGNYTFSIGSSEAKQLDFLNDDGTSKEIEKVIDVKNKQLILKIKKENNMKIIDKDFDFSKRLGEKIWCVECVTNDENEYSIEVYECSNEEDAKKQADDLNAHNKDKKCKFIAIEYTVCEDCLQVI